MRKFIKLFLTIFLLNSCGGVGDGIVIYKITGKLNGNKIVKNDISIRVPPYHSDYKKFNHDSFENNFRAVKVEINKEFSTLSSEVEYHIPFIFLVIPPIGSYPKTANLPVFLFEINKCKEKWLLFFIEKNKLEYKRVTKNGLINADEGLFSGSLQKSNKFFGWNVNLNISLDQILNYCKY